MKTIFLYLIFMIRFLACVKMQAQEEDLKDTIHYRYDTTLQKEYIHSIPWRYSPFISIASGYPMTGRIEIGQNLGSWFALGLSGAGYDQVTTEKDLPKIGVFLMLKVPFYKWRLVPYIYANRAKTWKFFGRDDKYTQVSIGTMLPLFSWLNLRPEIGVCRVNKYISGGSALLGGSTPEHYENTSYMAANIVLEINFFGYSRSRKLKQKSN